MSATPNHAAVINEAVINISTANTARDGTGTITTLISAGTSGSRIERVEAAARAATTAGVIRIFLHDGVNFHLIEEILVTVVTPSTTVEVWTGRSKLITPDTPIFLKTGHSLRVSTHNAESFTVWAHGGDY